MTDSTPPTVASRPAGGGVLIALVPWIAFTLVAAHGTLKAGAIAALVIAAGVCTYTSRSGHTPKMIELAALCTFAAFTVIAFVADPSVTHWLTRYARAVASGVLTLLMFASLAVVPFTEQYARESTPREVWSSPVFRHINRRLTVMWGAIFTVMTASHIAAGAINQQRATIIFNWLIPIALIMYGARHSKPDGHPVTQPQSG